MGYIQWKTPSTLYDVIQYILFEVEVNIVVIVMNYYMYFSPPPKIITMMRMFGELVCPSFFGDIIVLIFHRCIRFGMLVVAFNLKDL